MMRLVQGDVGSGKTVVAALAAVRAVEHGRQAAVMAPTELLAEQHARNFAAWLEPLGIRVALLTGRHTGRRARRADPGAGRGRGAGGRRHTRVVPGGCRVPRARARDRRRTAPLRRASAIAAAREGRGWRPLPASARHDRDADSAHAGDDGLRRPRRLGDRRAAPGPHADSHGGASRDTPRRSHRAHSRRLQRGPAGLLGLPADRGVGAIAPPGRDGDRGGACAGAARGCASVWCTVGCPRSARTPS